MRCLLAFVLLSTTAFADSAKIKCAANESSVPAYANIATARARVPSQKLYCGVTVEVLEKQDVWLKVSLPVSGSTYFVSASAVEETRTAAPSIPSANMDTSRAVFQLLMTPDELRDSGIESLNPSQRAALAKWVVRYTQLLSSSQSEPSQAPPGTGTFRPNAPKIVPRTPPPVAANSVIETRIEGDFEGWEGDTIFKLDNGQIWQQSGYSYTYHYAYRPEALIYWSPNSNCFKLKVEDVDDQICVKQLK